MDNLSDEYHGEIFRQMSRQEAWIEKRGRALTHKAWQAMARKKRGSSARGRRKILDIMRVKTGLAYDEVYTEDWRVGYALVCEESELAEEELRKEAEQLFPFPNPPQILADYWKATLPKTLSDEDIQRIRDSKRRIEQMRGIGKPDPSRFRNLKT